MESVTTGRGSRAAGTSAGARSLPPRPGSPRGQVDAADGLPSLILLHQRGARRDASIQHVQHCRAAGGGAGRGSRDAARVLVRAHSPGRATEPAGRTTAGGSGELRMQRAPRPARTAASAGADVCQAWHHPRGVAKLRDDRDAARCLAGGCSLEVGVRLHNVGAAGGWPAGLGRHWRHLCMNPTCTCMHPCTHPPRGPPPPAGCAAQTGCSAPGPPAGARRGC